MFIVMVSSITNVVFFLGEGDFRSGYELSTGAMMILATVTGIILSNTIIKKLGRPSILIFLLAAVALLATLILPVNETLKLISNPELRKDLFKFSSFCPS